MISLDLKNGVPMVRDQPKGCLRRETEIATRSVARPFEPDPGYAGEGNGGPFPIAGSGSLKIQKMHKKRSFKFFFLLLLGGGCFVSLVAQMEESAPELEPIEAEASSGDDFLGFGQTPATTISGFSRWLLDTPRAVSVIPETFPRTFSGEGLEALFTFAPGVGDTSQFGHVTTPNIRGDVAEFYIGGQRRSNNQYGFKPSLNAFDSFMVLRGAPSLILGPGFHSGGALLVSPKQARLDGHQVILEADWGGLSWSEDSWFSGRVQVDVSRVLKENQSGIRFSYEGRGNETFLNSPAAVDDSHSFYGNFRWERDSGWSGYIAGEFFWENAPQLLGVNRPSPSLFASNAYMRGSGAFRDFGSGSVFVVNHPTAGPERIALDPGASLLSERDRSRARTGWLQMELRSNGSIPFKNQTFIEGVDRERIHEFEYFEFVEQFTWENRSEWRWDWEFAKRPMQTTAGLSIRWEQRESYVNFFNEYPVAFDISGGATRFSVRSQYPTLVAPGIPGPEGLEFFGLPFSPETTDSELWNPALFWESSLEWNPFWTLAGGIRLDGYLAEARDPLTPNGASDSDSVGQWSGAISLLYQPEEDASFYLTLSNTNAVEGSIAGGGLMLNANGVINRDNLENRSRLLEVGWKQQFSDRGEWAITAFHQTRKRIEIRGPRSDIRVQGVEVEGKWNWSDQAFGFFNLTWNDGDYKNSAPSQLGGRSVYDLYAPGYGPDGQGTGRGYDFFFTNQVPSGDYPIPGLSPWTANWGMAWKQGSGVLPGFRIWADYRDAQPGNLDQEFFLPEQWEFHAGLDYQVSGWQLQLDFLNILDETLWHHNGGTFFNNQLVSRGAPARVRLRVVKSF